jgi:hypothetical protein
MISIVAAGARAYDTVDDEATITVAMPSVAPPTATTEYVYLAFWCGRVLSGHTATGMQGLNFLGFPDRMAGVMWSGSNLDSYLEFGPPPPLVLTRTATGSSELDPPTLAAGMSVRIVAYRITKTPPEGHNLGLTINAFAYQGYGVSSVGGSMEFTGLIQPQFFTPGWLFTDAQLWPGDPAGPTVQHYAMAFFNMQAPAWWRGDEFPPGNPDEIEPYFDGVPTTGCTFDDPVPVLGQPALTRRYDPAQPYTRNAVWDSLDGGIQQSQYPLDNDVVIRTPSPTLSSFSFGDATNPDVDPPVVVFDMQYTPLIFCGHLRIREELLPFPDQPPPVVVPAFCPDNLPATVAAGPVRVRTGDPVRIRTDRRGIQAQNVTAVVS